MHQTSLTKVMEAAETSLATGMTDRKMSGVTGVALNACATDLAAALGQHDRIGPCVAVLVDLGGDHPEPGMIAVTEDRLFVAWWKGLFRPKATVRAFAFTEITAVTCHRRKARSISPLSDAITFFSGGQRYTLIFHSAWMDETAPRMVADLIGGAASFAPPRPESTD